MRRIARSLFIVIPASLFAAGGPAIPKFEQINEHVYRGAQPTARGFEELAKMGIKSVVDLRREDQQVLREKQIVTALGMRFVSVPMTMHAPTDEQIAKVMEQLQSQSAWPVYVHCHGGRDRTGTVVACYRIAHDGWKNNTALDEANHRGLRMYDGGLQRFILHYRPPLAVVASPAS